MNMMSWRGCLRTIRLVVLAALAGGSLDLFGALPAHAFVLSTGPTNGPFGGYVCADVRNGSLAPGTPVQAYDCNGEPNQQFEFVGSMIYTMGGQRCLDLDMSGVQPYTYPVVSNPCDPNSPTQTSWLTYAGSIISGYAGGSCLDATNMANGTQLVVTLRCTGDIAPSPQWLWQIK